MKDKMDSSCRMGFSAYLRDLEKFVDSWRETVETLLNDDSIRQCINRNDAFLLRVGGHSGIEKNSRPCRENQAKGQTEKPLTDSSGISAERISRCQSVLCHDPS